MQAMLPIRVDAEARLNAAMAPEHRGWTPGFGGPELVVGLPTTQDHWAGLDGAVYPVGATWWADLHVMRPDLRRAFTRFTTPHPTLPAAVEAMAAHVSAAYRFMEANFR